MTYPEQWSIDPGENTKPPPLGAPENGLSGDKISDTFRVVMAGIREAWNRVGTLGLQNKDNVDITGGRIRSAVVVEATIATAQNSLKLEGLTLQQVIDEAIEQVPPATGVTLQQAYNVCWPVGSLRWLLPNQSAGILVPSGIVATWQEQTSLADRLLAIKGTVLGDTWGGSGTTIEVAIGSTALTINQMPLHGHPTRISTAAGTADPIGGLMLDDDNVVNYDGFTGSPSNDAGEQIGGAGGGQPHGHSATVTPPKGCSLRLYRRTA